MTAITAPVFIVHGDYSEETRKHPALVFMEDLTRNFYDSRDHTNVHEWLAEDFSVTNIDGTHQKTSREEAFKHASGFHTDLLQAQHHVPYTIMVQGGEEGYTVHCQVIMYANLAGNPAQGEKKVKDDHGNEWDVALPGFYQVELVWNREAKHHDLLVQHAKMIFDSWVVISALRKRGFSLDE